MGKSVNTLITNQFIKNKKIATLITIEGKKRQIDTFSCSIFALRDIVAFLNHPHIFATLLQKVNPEESVVELTIQDLPEELTKMAQQNVLLDNYINCHKPEEIVEIQKMKDKNIQNMNTMIDRKHKKYLKIDFF